MKCCRLGASSVYTIQPCTSLQCYFIQSHIRRVYVCLAVTCHLHFWQNDRDLYWCGYAFGFENLIAETWPANTCEREDLPSCGEHSVYSGIRPLGTATHTPESDLRAAAWPANTPGEGDDLQSSEELPVYSGMRPSSYRSSCGTARPTRI